MNINRQSMLWLVLGLLMLPAWAQSEPVKSAGAPTKADVSPSDLESQFLKMIRDGDALKFLAYIPEDGVHLGRHADHETRVEIEQQLTSRTGLYCKLFDSACLASTLKKEDDPPCSYRELLNGSQKVRTASTEATRNGVRQAIIVAEVQNEKCGGHMLIDFIFNHQEGGWKLFSIP